jgi:hypothetical protein
MKLPEIYFFYKWETTNYCIWGFPYFGRLSPLESCQPSLCWCGWNYNRDWLKLNWVCIATHRVCTVATSAANYFPPLLSLQHLSSLCSPQFHPHCTYLVVASHQDIGLRAGEKICVIINIPSKFLVTFQQQFTCFNLAMKWMTTITTNSSLPPSSPAMPHWAWAHQRDIDTISSPVN